jgi:hypothetical protein
MQATSKPQTTDEKMTVTTRKATVGGSKPKTHRKSEFSASQIRFMSRTLYCVRRRESALLGRLRLILTNLVDQHTYRYERRPMRDGHTSSASLQKTDAETTTAAHKISQRSRNIAIQSLSRWRHHGVGFLTSNN